MMGIRRRERAPRRGRPEALVTVQRTPIQLGNRRW